MKDIFPGYYQPKEEDFEALWRDCLFVPDANVLLDLYRYSDGTRREMLGVFGTVEDRLWMPHQVAWEYQRHRPWVIREEASAFDRALDLLTHARNSLSNELRQFRALPVDDWISRTDALFDEIANEISRLRDMHPNLLQADEVREQIDKLFFERVGAPYPPEELDRVRTEAKRRYEQSIPPGYKDADKRTSSAYGDYVLWRQVLDHAAEAKQPVVMITGERKEDWWLEVGGTRLGPRPELAQEMWVCAGVRFHLYATTEFMKHARRFGGRRVQIAESAVNEVDEIQRADAAWSPDESAAELHACLSRLSVIRRLLRSLSRSKCVSESAAARVVASAEEMVEHLSVLPATSDSVALGRMLACFGTAIESLRYAHEFARKWEFASLKERGELRVWEMANSCQSALSDLQSAEQAYSWRRRSRSIPLVRESELAGDPDSDADIGVG